ncbi:MAG: hypothetical protein PHV28_09185, partial [Kiritimatiellae bacterium]|nr:hypothetical protein [Kiritimatiellia bacterium]
AWESVEVYRDWHDFFHWALEFPDVMGGDEPGFDATVGNPPWDIVKPNSQEFFSAYDPAFRSYKKQKASKVSEQLMEKNPAIRKKWEEYCDGIAKQSAYVREEAAYGAVGKGDINTFKLFLEQFFTVLRPGGQMGIVTPSGLYTDQGCLPLRKLFFGRSQIQFLYCFENRNPPVFPAVHRMFKFICFCTRKGGKTDGFKCAFMQHDPARLPAIHGNALTMTVEQVKKFSPDSLSVMEFNEQESIDVATAVYGNWPLLGDKMKNTWNIRFRRELDMTNASHLFKTAATKWPLFEGKMIWQFDSVFESPRFWVDGSEAERYLGASAWETKCFRVGYRDIAASTNERTLVATVIPPSFHGNKIPTVTPFSSKERDGPRDDEGLFLSALLCSFVVDFIIRQKITTTLNYFYMYSLPVPRPFSGHALLIPISARAARLVSTENNFSSLWSSVFSNDWNSPEFWYPSIENMDYGPAHEREIRERLAESAKSLTKEWTPACGVHDRLPDRRDTGDRAQIRAEIDAYVAHLYGLSRDDFAYILDTFPVLKRKEMKAFGEFMSKRKCLEEYDRLVPILNDE